MDVAGFPPKKNLQAARELSLTENSDTTNNTWDALHQVRFSTESGPLWKLVAFSTFLATEFQGSKEIFDLLAKRIYSVILKRKAYEAFFSGDIPLAIPKYRIESSDLRYYEYLSGISLINGAAAPELILGLALEHLEHEVEEEDEIEIEANNGITNKEEAQKMEMLFKNAMGLIPPSVHSNARRVETLIPYSDKNAVTAHLASSNLILLGLSATDLMKETIKFSKEKRISNFDTNLSEFRDISKEKYEIDRLLYTREFQRYSKFDVVSNGSVDHFLRHLAFQRGFAASSALDLDKSSKLPDGYFWCERLVESAIFQSLQNASLVKRDCSTSYSKEQGMLLVTLKCPGPVGCFEFETNECITFRTKIAFSLFHDLFDNIGSVLGDAHPLIDGKQQVPCYQMGDKPVLINQHTKYMYPADCVIEILTESNNKQEVKRTKLTYNDNTLTFQQPAGSPPYLNLSFFDGSVFSITEVNGELKVSVSTPDGNWASFHSSNCIIQRNLAVSKADGRNPSAEKSKVMFPSGQVIQYLATNTTRVMYPNGAVKVKNAEGEWSTTSKDGIFISDANPHLNKTLLTATENDLTNKCVKKTRVDYVTVCTWDNGDVETAHSDGTNIKKSAKKILIQTLPGKPQFTFTDHSQEILCSDYITVKKHHGPDGCSFEITRPDLSLNVSSSGQCKVKFSRVGLHNANSIPDDRHTLDMDWRQGTFKFVGLQGREFTLDGKGETKIRNIFTSETEYWQFGPKILREHMQSNVRVYRSGNTPSYYLILPEGKGGYELLCDQDMRRYYTSKLSVDIEDHETSNSANSVGLSTVCEEKFNNGKPPLLLYRTVTKI